MSPLLLEALHDGDWRKQAACKERADIDWFPSSEAPGGRTRAQRANVTRARAVCASCPVRADCLDEALSREISAGIWAGTTESQRKRMPKRGLRTKPAKCGTDAGYMRHVRELGEPACQECREAHAAAERRRKARRRLERAA